MNVIEARGLGKRYRGNWALRDCSLAVPAGSVVALVGPNGAGKTTLLNLMVGLIEPTEGSIEVLDGQRAGSPAALDGVGFVAQDAPLYQGLTVDDTLRVIGRLNRRWDRARALRRLEELGLPLGRKVGRMSGGQQAQLALTLALARRPRVLVLDEPLAMLDPLARFDFMDTVMTAAAEDGLTVVLSSHVIAELERVADYLVVLAAGRLQVAGPVRDVLAAHRVLTVPPGAETAPPGAEVVLPACPAGLVNATGAGARTRMLVQATGEPAGGYLPPDGWQANPASLEETVLAYLRQPGATAMPVPRADQATAPEVIA